MKTSFPVLHHRTAKGFSLMEVLIVMVIIVVLATLTIGIYTWMETRKNEEACTSITKRINMGLTQYYSDHGRYPYGTEKPFQNSGLAVADGGDYSSNVVYMALFGDFKNTGIPEKNATIYDTELNPASQPGANPTVREIQLRDKAGQQKTLYILSDPWGQPYRYTLGYDQSIPRRGSNAKYGLGNNPTFDFWSFGKDGDSNPKNLRAPENADDIGNQPKL